MATPGYPQMMHGMPGGAMQMPPARRGAPKIVPVIVSAGLAVGVFCGLLFGLGTGKEEAAAAPAPKKGSVMSDDPSAPEGLGATAALPVPPKNGAAVAVAPPPPVPAAGSGSGSAAAAAPTIKTVKLTVKVTPDGAAKDAKITVDGKEITGTEVELPSDKKNARVVVTSNGFHSFDKTIDLQGDTTEVGVELLKKASGGTASPGFGGASHVTPTIPKAPPGEPQQKKPKKPAGGGVIDI